MADDTKFELHLVGRVAGLGQVVSRPTESDPNVARKRKSQEEIRLLADTYKEEALLAYVHTMRTTVDERIRIQCADRLLNRAVGMAKALSEEEKKGADAGSILDVLAAVSTYQGQIERTPPDAPPIEHEALSYDDSVERLLDDIEADDAELVDD